MRNSDKALVDMAVRFFKNQKWPQSSKQSPTANPYALAANKIMLICKSDYRSLARDLGPIALKFGLGNEADLDKGSATVRPETVQSQRNDMAKGKNGTLFPAFLCWLWLNHRTDTIGIFEACQFPWQHTLDKAQAEIETTYEGVLVAPQNKNKFDLSFLLENAKDRIILVAQNHWHLISQPVDSDTDFWPKIAAAVKRGVTVEIVAMHPDGEPPLPLGEVPDAIQLWTLYMKAPAFRSHVVKCWETLDRFAALHRQMTESVDPSSKYGKLNLYRAYFVPMTITIVDPLASKGMAVISPRTANEVSGTRPEFVLRRSEHEEAFLYYWSFVENGIANQGWGPA